MICLDIDGKEGQIITVRHAELLHDGELFVENLRTAKATVTYICKDGKQSYSPKLTYMGFRYAGISGIDEDKIHVYARAIYSDIDTVGDFTCSDNDLNRLQSNVVWSAKSNFVDIPTDCPQRDERQGWTGDISICWRHVQRLSRFLNKWLADAEQKAAASVCDPRREPLIHGLRMLGDSCVIVPWITCTRKQEFLDSTTLL